MKSENSQIFEISDTPTNEEMDRIHHAVEIDKRNKTHGGYYDAGIELGLVLKDSIGNMRGGATASIVYNVMHFEVLWVEENLRRHGYGSQLVLDAEQIGLAKGGLAAQTWTFSFQALGYFEKIGYQILGVSDGYPHPVK